MEKDFNSLTNLWKNFNKASSLLTKAMGGTANEVGEFAERLVSEYYNAEQLTASQKSADLKTNDNKLIQVKSRKLEKLKATSLNVIRSWDFDILVVVLFTKDGNILKAIEINAKDAQVLSKADNHQNGDILTTNKDLLNHSKSRDITNELQAIINGQPPQELVSGEQTLQKNYVENKIIKSSIIKNNDFELEFVPCDEKLFKQQLLQTKKANRTWFYLSGKILNDTWDARSFTTESNLRGNINSNNKVKQRNETGLIKLKLEIIE